jgi:TRAP-type transport system periplasmic protein
MTVKSSALAAIIAATLCLGGPASAQQFTMKLSSPTINDVAHEWMKVFKAGVEARTKGRVKVEIYPANQLGQIPATVEGVAFGTIELAIPAIGFLLGLEPRFQVFDTPGLFVDIPHGEKVLTDPDIKKRVAEFGAAKGVEPLFVALTGDLMLLSHKPVRALADLKGQKIRVPGAAPLQVEPMRKQGVSPISMPLGEVLPAMQNRAIDGTIANLTAFTNFKFYDVAKTATYVPGAYGVISGVVNRNFMKSLGPDLEAIVRDEAAKAEKVYATWGVEDLDRLGQIWTKNGGELVKLPEAEGKRYVTEAGTVLPDVFAKNPRLKDDYDALVAAAARLRQ